MVGLSAILVNIGLRSLPHDDTNSVLQDLPREYKISVLRHYNTNFVLQDFSHECKTSIFTL